MLTARQATRIRKRNAHTRSMPLVPARAVKSLNDADGPGLIVNLIVIFLIMVNLPAPLDERLAHIVEVQHAG